jgi:uncharacterized protein
MEVFVKRMKVVIVHGCPGSEEKAMDPERRTYDKHWIPWIKKMLYEENIESFFPLMPEPWAPNYEEWKKEFDKFNIYEDDVLVGHSCGCAFLVRWLGDTKKKIKKLILVAPWKISDEESKKEFEIMEKFYDYEIDKSVKENVEEVIIFTADDEEEIGKESVKIFSDALGGEIIELNNHGHYCFGDMGTEEFPELLSKILK